MGIKVANNAFATLAAGISDSATSITVASGQGARFPILGAGDYFYATLINTSNQLEIVKCTARSADVLTVVRAQEGTTARAYDGGDRIEIRITAATFEDATDVYDVPTTSTGAFAVPRGTTAQRPASPEIGYLRFNTDLGALENFTAEGWLKASIEIPTLTTVDGTIFSGAASTLTLTGTRFGTGAGTVRFTSGATVENVTVTPASQTSATVTVPSAIFNLSAGVSVDVQFINADNGVSNAISKTTVALPTGGTITTAGGFRIHTFTSSGSFVVPTGLTLSNVEYLVVAGGGGGGSSYGGGGGAGGYRCSVSGETSGGGSSAESPLVLTAGTSYTITVGAAGAAPGSGSRGGTGGNSVFGSITANGGGGGGYHSSPGDGLYNGASGGSGGGGSIGPGGGSPPTGLGGSGTSGQGYAGGDGAHNAPEYPAGGGGGAGSIGGTYSGTVSGSGGAGVSSSISGSAVTRAGGGGGGNGGNGTRGTGGSGGGGNGQSSGLAGSAGSINTGGGGGGGGVGSLGFAGGSGIVIVRYSLPT